MIYLHGGLGKLGGPEVLQVLLGGRLVEVSLQLGSPGLGRDVGLLLAHLLRLLHIKPAQESRPQSVTEPCGMYKACSLAQIVRILHIPKSDRGSHDCHSHVLPVLLQGAQRARQVQS